MLEHEFDRLVGFRSTDAPVLSVYFDVPADPAELQSVHARVHSLLKPVHELAASRELAHAARESVRADIAKVEDLAQRGAEMVGRGVAAFTCSREGLYTEVVLETHFRERAVADETPYLRPLIAAVSEARTYLVVVVERARSWFFELFMRHVDEALDLIEPPRRRPGRPSEHDLDRRHVQNRAETLTRKHHHATAEAALRLLHEQGIEHVIVGGHQETVSEFADLLPKELRQHVVGTFVIDPSTMTPATVREHAQPIVDEYERAERTQLVATARERVEAGGNGAAGLEWCLLATNEHAVATQLVHDHAERPGRVCDICGWLGLAGEVCPVCGRVTHGTPDVIDEMAEAVLSTGGRVEHVDDNESLARHIVMALLRFPVPRPA